MTQQAKYYIIKIPKEKEKPAKLAAAMQELKLSELVIQFLDREIAKTNNKLKG